jgi:hypothetical protein
MLINVADGINIAPIARREKKRQLMRTRVLQRPSAASLGRLRQTSRWTLTKLGCVIDHWVAEHRVDSP